MTGTVLEIVLGSNMAVVVAAVAVLIVIEARKRKMLQMLQWLRRRRRRDDPEKSLSEYPEAPLLVGETLPMMPLESGAIGGGRSDLENVEVSEEQRGSTVDDGAALWEIVRSLLRLCGDLKAVSKIAEIKVELRSILNNIRRVGYLYQDRFVCGHCRSINSIMPHLSSSSRSIGSDIRRLRKESQRFILAIVNVAIPKSRSGPATVAGSAFVSTLTDLRRRYHEIKSIESSLGIDGRIIVESKWRVRDVAHRCSLGLTSLIEGPIRGEYEGDKFVRRRCRAIEEGIQKMGESAECGEEWISHVRLLGGPIQLLMLAIVNVELGEGRRSSGGDGPQIGSNVGESTSTRNFVSTSSNQE